MTLTRREFRLWMLMHSRIYCWLFPVTDEESFELMKRAVDKFTEGIPRLIEALMGMGEAAEHCRAAMESAGAYQR